MDINRRGFLGLMASVTGASMFGCGKVEEEIEEIEEMERVTDWSNGEEDDESSSDEDEDW